MSAEDMMVIVNWWFNGGGVYNNRFILENMHALKLVTAQQKP